MKVPAEILTLLRQEKSFIIATHVDPDADTLGSAIALSMALEAAGKETVLFNKSPFPALYNFLPGRDKLVSSAAELRPQNSVLLLLDFNEPERAGLEDITFPRSAVIDHHETMGAFGDIRWIMPSAPATGLMVYSLIKELGAAITKDIAVNLYTAIAVDTGTFRFSNTDSETLRACAELIDAGARPAEIADALYESWSDGRFRLLIMALDTLEISEGIAFTHVTKEMFTVTGTTPEDTDNFSTFPRKIKSLKLSAFFRETDNGWWRVSLRSREDINAAEIASAFNGGGHRKAAGYKIQADLKTAKKALLKALNSKS